MTGKVDEMKEPTESSKAAQKDAQIFWKALVEEEGLSPKLVQLPGDDSYEANRKNHFNLDVICLPLLFVTPTTAKEVSVAIRGYSRGLKQWPADTPPPSLCICGGRHSVRSFVDHSVVLDLSLMQKVNVDVQNQTVTVQGGVKIQRMMDTLAPYHLAPITGTHSDTGVIGLTLGGGQGFLSKQFGPAVDQIVSAEIVLADGSIHTVYTDMPQNKNPKQAKDILFNIRGGGGNVGVITSLSMKVYPIRNLAMLEKVNLVFTQKGVQDVLVRYGEWSLQTPDDCTSAVILPLRAPIVVALGISSNTLVIPQTVSAAQANAKVNVDDIPGLSDLSNNRLGSWFRLSTKFKVKDIHTEALEELSKEHPHHYYFTNVFVPAITPEIAAVFAQAQRGKEAKGISGQFIIFNHAGNKTQQVPAEETAFEMRDKKYWLLCQTTWKTTGHPNVDAQARTKVAEFNRWFRQALLKAGGQKTVHAVTNQEQDFGLKTDHGLLLRYTNKQRIIQTQKELDPDGVFRMNQTLA